MEDYLEIDRKVLDISRDLFATKGILQTEMKDIARILGNSRSTLYRHFPGKEAILFHLANETLSEIMNATRLPMDKEFKNGFDALEWQLHSMVSMMLNRANDIVFLRDFDCLYTHDYPEGTASTQYERNIRTITANNEMRVSLNRGIADGSIRRVKNPELTLLTMINGCFAVSQRILPREKHYLIENGYGREMLDCFLEMSLSAIRAEQK